MPKTDAQTSFFQLRPTESQLVKFRRAAERDDRSINKWALRILETVADHGVYPEPEKKGGRRG